MIRKKIVLALAAAFSLGGAAAANAAVFTSTTSSFTGDLAITGFKDSNPLTYSITLSNLDGALDIFVPPSSTPTGTTSGQRFGNVSIDYTPAHAGFDLVSNSTSWIDLGTATFNSSGITGSHFEYDFNANTFKSDGTPVNGGSFSASASALNLMLGNLFGGLGANVGTGSVAVTHTLAPDTWTMNVTETVAGGTGFSGLFSSLDSTALGGNNDGQITGAFSANGAVSLNTTPGVPPTVGVTETAPLLPMAQEAGTPPGTFTFDNLAIGAEKNAQGEIIGIETPLWIDPLVAVGYTYEIAGSGPTLKDVTAPGLGTVADADGYEVWVWNGTDFVLAQTIAPGATYSFAPGVTRFQIRGIDPNLGLDPLDAQGFPIGITFNAPGVVDLTMTTLTADVGAVPLPGVLSLLGVGFSGLALSRRRQTPSFLPR